MTKPVTQNTNRICFSSLLVSIFLAFFFIFSGWLTTEPADSSNISQTWEIVEQSGQKATLSVDSSGYFTGRGWRGGGSAGISPYDISIKNGRMSGTSITFEISASYSQGAGSISGTGKGTLNASFPNATSASGTMSGTISDPLGTRDFTSTWTARQTFVKLTPKDFDFDVDVDPPLLNIMQGETATIAVTVKLVRGESQPVKLTATEWERTVDISSRFAQNPVWPTGSTTFYVATNCNTPPDSYLFTVRGETEGTFRTSVDAVNVKVIPNPDCPPSVSVTAVKTAQEHNQNGLAYSKEGRLDEAILEYNKAINLEPGYAQAYNNRGHAYYNKGNYDQTITDCTRAIELDPSLALAYNTRGIAYQAKGDYEKAMADFNRAIHLDPGRHWPYYNRGLIYKIQGKKEKAIADFERSIELTDDPSFIQKAKEALKELK